MTMKLNKEQSLPFRVNKHFWVQAEVTIIDVILDGGC